MADKNKQEFSCDENKLLKACVLGLNNSQIHGNMKVGVDDSVVKLTCCD